MSTSETLNRPAVFLGSASESLKELEFISDALKPHAKPVQWTDDPFVIGGTYFLESLLQQVNTFDFAVFIFGRDDTTTSRGFEQAAPRDNVIFETGVFMSHLGRERTLIVAPEGGTTPLKILSDFAGLTLINYKLPNDRADLRKALERACDSILKRIEKLGPRPLPEALAQPGPPDALRAEQVLNELIDRSLKEDTTTTIRNIALDMEITWPIMKSIIDRPDLQRLEWQALMIDPSSEAIKNVASETVNLEEACRNQAAMARTLEESKDELERRNIKIECRAYKSVPLMHGFLVNKNTLLMTFCGMSRDGKLVGRPNPYWRYEEGPDSVAIDHSFRVFKGWFAYHWTSGRKIWPL